MPNVSWIAQVIFYGSYFIAWCLREIPHTAWLNVTAWAALITAVALLLAGGYPLLNRRPQA